MDHVLARLEAGASPPGFSARDFPVTVRQSPAIKPFSRRYFKTAGIPSDLMQVGHHVFPRSALRVGQVGEFAPLTLWKLRRWSSLHVDGPGHRNQVQHGIRFGTAQGHHDHHRVLERPWRVMMCAGPDVLFEERANGLCPARKAFRRACRESSGRGRRAVGTSDMPIALGCAGPFPVLAVYIPPQAPAPVGQLAPHDGGPFFTSVIRRRGIRRTPGTREMMSSFLSPRHPGWIVPPVDHQARGGLRRPMAMTQTGACSCRSPGFANAPHRTIGPPSTVSIESAIKSRDIAASTTCRRFPIGNARRSRRSC